MSAGQNQGNIWSPPTGYQQLESQVPGVSVFAPQPKKAEIDQAVSYACPNCGANTAYNVSAGGVACEYCGYIASVTAERIGRSAEDFEFTLETLSQARQGWGTQRQVLHCDSCGAELSISAGAITTTCAFCASNQVNIITIPDETLRPRFLIPFKIPPEKTVPLAKDWLGKGWYHPSELAGNVIVRRFYGIYLPFWTFNARVDASGGLRWVISTLNAITTPPKNAGKPAPAPSGNGKTAGLTWMLRIYWSQVPHPNTSATASLASCILSTWVTWSPMRPISWLAGRPRPMRPP
jgi:ribosomal protein L37AE/L43A